MPTGLLCSKREESQRWALTIACFSAEALIPEFTRINCKARNPWYSIIDLCRTKESVNYDKRYKGRCGLHEGRTFYFSAEGAMREACHGRSAHYHAPSNPRT